MTRTFIIINGTTVYIKSFAYKPSEDYETQARHWAINWMDHSEEIIVKPITEIHFKDEKTDV